jgi:hypothetical protein
MVRCAEGSSASGILQVLRCKCSSEPRQAASDATLDGSLRFIEQLGDHSVAVAPEVRELHGPPLGIGELRQGDARRASDRLGDDQAIHRLGGCARSGGIALLAGTPSCVRSHDVECSPVRDREEKGAQRAALGVEAVRPLPEAQEHLLGYVLGPLVVADEPPGERDHGSPVTPHGLGQSRLVVPGDLSDELAVIGLAEVLPRHVSHLVGVGAREPYTDCRRGSCEHDLHGAR